MNGTTPEKKTRVAIIGAGTPTGSRLMAALLEKGIDVKPLNDVIDEGGLTSGFDPLTIERLRDVAVNGRGMGRLPTFCLPSIGRGLKHPTNMFSEEVYIPNIAIGYAKIKKGPGKGQWREYYIKLDKWRF